MRSVIHRAMSVLDEFEQSGVRPLLVALDALEQPATPVRLTAAVMVAAPYVMAFGRPWQRAAMVAVAAGNLAVMRQLNRRAHQRQVAAHFDQYSTTSWRAA